MGKILLTRQDSIQKLKTAVKQADDAEQKTRIRAIIKLRQGITKCAVAEEFLITRKTLYYWIEVYNEKGVNALHFSKGGRPNGNPKWDTNIFDDLIKEIDKQDRYWSVPLMQAWIKENHQEDIPENTVWYHMRNLDYSYKSSRPHPAKGDKKKQNIFKKKA